MIWLLFLLADQRREAAPRKSTQALASQLGVTLWTAHVEEDAERLGAWRGLRPLVAS